MRVMGLDVGDKRIGVAVSDELGIAAHPVAVIQRTGSVKKDIVELRAIIQEYGVQRIVIGMPIMMAGTVGVQAQKVEAFAVELKKRVKTPVVAWDERLTTAQVERMLIEAGQRRAARKEVIDKLAAAVILQSYLDRRKAEAGRGENGDEA